MSESLNWMPIRKFAINTAAALGHTLGEFKLHAPGASPSRFKMASCEICYGCCWIAHSHRGYTAGGRLLKYQCGTHEAAGTLPPDGVDPANDPASSPNTAVEAKAGNQAVEEETK